MIFCVESAVYEQDPNRDLISFSFQKFLTTFLQWKILTLFASL